MLESSWVGCKASDPQREEQSTYLAAFLSFWLCVFAFLHTSDRIIHPETFETISLIASSCTFSLVVPILASIYHGSNGITNVMNPSHLQWVFPGHYLCGWISHYFRTYHVLQPTPLGPLMVHYFYFYTTCNNIGDVYHLIHEGKVSNLGCLMLTKNHSRPLLTLAS